MIGARGKKEIVFGETVIDLTCVEQVVSETQTRAIGWMINYYAKHYADRGLSLFQGLKRVMEDIEAGGMDVISPYPMGELSLPRIFEAGAAINRMRTLRL